MSGRPISPVRAGAPLAAAAAALLLMGAPAAAEGQQGPPPPLPTQALAFPPFEEFTLENGLRVVVLTYGSQPVLSARLYAPGGRTGDPEGKSGLASLAATVLTRGTESLSATEISERIEGVGGTLSASVGQSFLTLSTVVLTDAAETAFSLLGEVVRSASFPTEEVELARRQTLSGLQAELGNPQAIASRRFAAVVYGESHPQGTAPTPASVQSITRDDLVAYRDRVLRPGGSLLLVAGRVDRAEVEALARRHLGEWEGRAEPLLPPPPPEARTETRIYLVHRPGSVQSVVTIGHTGVEPGHPAEFTLDVLNRVLGGGSDARLFSILREERGWTYGAYSQFTRAVGRGTFSAQAEVRTEVTDSTVVEILAQMERMREEPVPAEELDGAKNFLAGSFPLRLETADQVANQLATTLLLGLPIEDVTQYPERIQGVDAAAVLAAGREHLRPDRAAIIVVGDGAELLERLEAIAPVLLFDVEGRPLGREEVVAAGSPR